MKVKKVTSIICTALLVLISTGLYSQKAKIENMPTYDYSKYHFGFVLGVNQMHFTIKPIENLNMKMFSADQTEEISADSAMLFSVEDDPTLGFTVGIVSNLRLGNYFDLRFIPSLTFGERNLDYRILKYRDGVSSIIEIRKNIPSTFIELPFHLKYKSARKGNMRAYLLSGFNYRIDLASLAKKKNEQADVQIKLKRNDISFELGVGFDWYFEWFKLGTELKMSYGALDMLVREDNIYTQGIEKLSSKIFQLSFTFE